MDSGWGIIFGCGLYIAIPLLIVFMIREARKSKKKEKQKTVEKASQVAPKEVPFSARLEESYTVFEISVPKSERWAPERARHLFMQLFTDDNGGLLRIKGDGQEVIWQVILPVKLPQSILAAEASIRSVYPNAEVVSYPYQYQESREQFSRDISPMVLALDFFAPIRRIGKPPKLDPLTSLVHSLSDMPEGSSFEYTIYIRRSTPSVVVEAEREKITRDTTSDFWKGALAAGIAQAGAPKGAVIVQPPPQKGTGREGTGQYIEEQQREFEQKLNDQYLYDCYIFIQQDGEVIPEGEVVQARVISPDGVLRTQFSTDYNGIVASLVDGWWAQNVSTPESACALSVPAIIDAYERGEYNHGKDHKSVLGHEEIALLWHLPHEQFHTAEIKWASKGKASKELLANEEGVIIGDSFQGGESQPIRIHPHDRETHMNIVGKTGVGKSTFMHNLIHQDIAAGKGVAVIDPHGKLVQDILRVSIPDDRIDDVVLLDIANTAYPPPLNPLSSQSEDDTYTASEIVAILDKVEPGGKLPGQTADTLLASLVTLRKQKSGTIRDVVRLFNDAEYRYQFINQVDDVITQEFWMYFEGLSTTRRDDVVNPVFRRVRKFYGNPILHPIMCHPAPLDIEQLIKENKIILLSLGVDTRKVPETQQTLVGVTVTSMIQMAAMSTIEDPTPFFLYIDEVQNFVTAPLDKILAEARKFKLRLTVANQYLDQLSGKTLKAVMGTVGATIVFQVGQDDAGVMAPYMAPEFDKSDLANMDKYYAAVKTRYLGNTQPAFSIATRPDPGDLESPEGLEREQLIRQRSIENYTPMSKEEVMAWLNNRYAPRIYTTPDTSGDGQQSIDWSVQAKEEE